MWLILLLLFALDGVAVVVDVGVVVGVVVVVVVVLLWWCLLFMHVAEYASIR